MHFYASRSRPESIFAIVLTTIIDSKRLYYQVVIMFLGIFNINLLQIKRILSKNNFFLDIFYESYLNQGCEKKCKQRFKIYIITT